MEATAIILALCTPLWWYLLFRSSNEKTKIEKRYRAEITELQQLFLFNFVEISFHRALPKDASKRMIVKLKPTLVNDKSSSSSGNSAPSPNTKRVDPAKKGG